LMRRREVDDVVKTLERGDSEDKCGSYLFLSVRQPA